MKESLDVGFKGMRFQDKAGTVVTQPISGSIKFKEGREKALSLESPRGEGSRIQRREPDFR